MRRSVLDRAADWLRRTLPNAHGAPRLALDPRELGVNSTDARLLELLGNDLTDRAHALRAALQGLDPNSAASSVSAYQQSLEEIDRLDELANAISALAQESKNGEPLVAVDLVDPLRRALARLAQHGGVPLGLRVKSPAALPRVMAKPPALVRTLSLCLEASSLATSDGPIVVHLSAREKDGRVNAVFRPTHPLSVIGPKVRERLHTTLALASRLATTFDAEVHVDSSGAAFVPRLRLLKEPGLAV